MTQLFTYAPAKDTDLLLAQMYGEMLAAGDLELLFAQPNFASASG